MFGIVQGAPTPGSKPALVTFLYPGMFAVVEATLTPVPVSNPNGELGSKRGRPERSTNKATARKPGPNERTLAAKNATSASRKITSMFERSSAEAGSSSSSALPPRANGPVPRLRGSTYSAAVCSRTGDRVDGPSSGCGSARPIVHHNQARPLELNLEAKLTSLIIFKGLQRKKSISRSKASV